MEVQFAQHIVIGQKQFVRGGASSIKHLLRKAAIIKVDQRDDERKLTLHF